MGEGDFLKIKCLKCEKEKVASAQNFYENTNGLLSSKKLPICKNCLTDYIGEKDSEGYVSRVQLVLALMDKPLLEELWNMRDRDWSRYIPQLSSFNQYKGLTFQDSTLDIKKASQINIEQKEVVVDFGEKYTDEEINEMMKFWGKGKLTLEDYEFLQNEYERLLNSYECDSYAMELLFQEASQQRLTIKKLREESKPVDKELKTLQDLLGSANVKPAQETGANAVEQASFGTLIKKYENERPVPEPDDEWKDVDGIRKYINVWFLGHLSRMMGVQNGNTTEYENEINKYKVTNPEYQDESGE